MNIADEEQKVYDYIEKNAEHFRVICDGVIYERQQILNQTGNTFLDSVNEQFWNQVDELIAYDVSYNTGVSVDVVYSVLSDINLPELIGVK